MSVKWGIIGCGNVAEYKGAPALYQIEGSERTLPQELQKRVLRGQGEQ